MDKNKKELLESQPPILVPVAEYETAGVVQGIEMPGGIQLMEMRGISPAVLHIYAQTLNAERFSIRGKWVFYPDPDSLTKYGEAPSEKLKTGRRNGTENVRRSVT